MDYNFPGVATANCHFNWYIFNIASICQDARLYGRDVNLGVVASKTLSDNSTIASGSRSGRSEGLTSTLAAVAQSRKIGIKVSAKHAGSLPMRNYLYFSRSNGHQKSEMRLSNEELAL
jgi:hypothetical protein